MQWIIDGFNLIGSRPDGWWRDRSAARRRLVDELSGFSARTGDLVTVVFDGREVAAEVDAGADRQVRISFAPGGPDAADRVIAAMAASAPVPHDHAVVTSDAGLALQVRASGVPVVRVSEFRRLLGASAGPG